jgi:hypothetical protein
VCAATSYLSVPSASVPVNVSQASGPRQEFASRMTSAKAKRFPTRFLCSILPESSSYHPYCMKLRLSKARQDIISAYREVVQIEKCFSSPPSILVNAKFQLHLHKSLATGQYPESDESSVHTLNPFLYYIF